MTKRTFTDAKLMRGSDGLLYFLTKGGSVRPLTTKELDPAVADGIDLGEVTQEVIDRMSPAPVVVADTAARKLLATYDPAPYIGMLVVQTNELVAGLPTILWMLKATDVTSDSSWRGMALINAAGELVAPANGVTIGDTVKVKIGTERTNAPGSITVRPLTTIAPGSVELFPGPGGIRSHFLAGNAADPNNFGYVKLECNLTENKAFLQADAKGTGTMPESFQILNFSYITFFDPFITKSSTSFDGTNTFNGVTTLNASASFKSTLIVDQTGSGAFLILSDYATITNNAGIYLRSSTLGYLQVVTGGRFEIKTNGGVVLFTVTSTGGMITNEVTQKSLSADPADPSSGNSVQWVSDGTGLGDAGDLMIKINVGGVVKSTTLVDYSSL